MDELVDPLINRLMNTSAPTVWPGDDQAKRAYWGYYRMEDIERSAKLTAQREHLAEIVVWYRAITVYFHGMSGQWDFEPPLAHESDLDSLKLQSQLIGLGIISAKASLDLLLSGYYSPAFSCIRHMIETFIQCMYVEVYPDKTSIWYQEPGGPGAQSKTPGCQRMISDLKSSKTEGLGDDILDRAYKAWSNMSKGSHPTGEGIAQAFPDEADGLFSIGGIYRPIYCLSGFEHGFYAIESLLLWLGRIRVQEPAWKNEMARLQSDIETIVDQVRARLQAETANSVGEAQLPGTSQR